MDVLFSVLAILIFALFLQKPISRLIKKDEDIPYIEVEDHIDKLTALKRNLNDIEQMITDVQIFTPHERATAFKLYMHTNNILADSASENILALLEEERKKLRSTLYLEIKNLYDRCNENCNGNNKVFNKNQSGEWLL